MGSRSGMKVYCLRGSGEANLRCVVSQTLRTKSLIRVELPSHPELMVSKSHGSRAAGPLYIRCSIAVSDHPQELLVGATGGLGGRNAIPQFVPVVVGAKQRLQSRSRLAVASLRIFRSLDRTGLPDHTG
jgi:hypothetical protein